jgi:hypothetical protein
MLSPAYAVFFEETFGSALAKIISTNWFKFSQLSLSNASRQQLIEEAKIIIALSK